MRNRMAILMMGAGIGAGLMYYLDPDRGRRRRSLVRDQFVHGGHKLRAAADTTARDMRNRITGTYASLRSWFDHRDPGDEVLTERVHARVGRLSSHPGSIDVSTRNGVVTLSGPILAREVPMVLERVRAVPGVKDVENRLEVHERPDHVPGLQGEATPAPRGERGAFRQTNWSPTARALAGAAGGLTALYGFGRRGAAGIAAGLAGLVLLARAATNLDLRRLTGIGVPRRAIDVQKTIHIDAPVDRVFAVWSDFENLPSFMTHVRRVRRLDDGRQGVRWRWTTDGPAGAPVDFDTVITIFEPERLLAWRTEPASTVQHAGRVRFCGDADGSTTVDIKMTYNPIAGALGHAVAWLLNADPRHRMNDDLMRLKTYLETGKPPHDAAQPLRAQTSAAPVRPSL